MDILDQVLEESTYYEMWENEKSEEAETRINNLKELLEVISEFDTLEGFLQHVSLMTDNDAGNELGEVTLMTLHAAKGSEYQVIFLPGWEDGLFPSFRSLEEGGEDGLEEERRLAYVGITRAKKELFLSYASNRRINGIWMSSLPSRFLKELPKDIANKIEANDYSAYSLYDENVSYDYTQKFKNQGYGPGWKRMSELQINNVKDKNLSQLPKNSENNFQINKFIKGDRVFHVKFGMGNVININDDKLDIKFDNAGHKKIQANFVEKQ
jgi:DNA helicase-2/ATP-dependent DNA helicase PcrA